MKQTYLRSLHRDDKIDFSDEKIGRIVMGMHWIWKVIDLRIEKSKFWGQHPFDDGEGK